MTKSVDLPAPKDPILKLFGRDYKNCNSSLEFNMDEQVSRIFHQDFADKYGCHIPFLGGDTYVANVSPRSTFCTRMSDYNTTQGEVFSVLSKLISLS